jgi:DNA-binding transcriptional regulator PaaX
MRSDSLEKIKKLVSSGGEGLTLAHSLLLNIALGEKLSLARNRKAQNAFYNLRRYKFVMRARDDRYTLTNKGERKLRTILIDEVIINLPKKWDGKWRLVTYDLPIRFKNARNAFRWKLKDLGFYQFQKSIWAYPYPCESELLFVADFFGVRKYIEIIEATKILDDKKLRAYFGL